MALSIDDQARFDIARKRLRLLKAVSYLIPLFHYLGAVLFFIGILQSTVTSTVGGLIVVIIPLAMFFAGAFWSLLLHAWIDGQHAKLNTEIQAKKQTILLHHLLVEQKSQRVEIPKYM